MCMYVRTERPVSQGPVRHRKDRPAEHVQEQPGRTKGQSETATTYEVDPFGFLNTKVKDIPVTEEYMTGCFGLNVESGYDKLYKVSAIFLDFFGKPFDFEPPKEENAVKIDSLITWFETKVEDIGFELATVKHDIYDEDCSEIDFVVYNPIPELDLNVAVFITSPVETLPKKAADLYAKFIKFLSSRMSLTLDIAYTNNYYLDMAMSYFDDPEENIDELEGEDRKMLQERRDLIANYKTGIYKKIFDDIDKLSTDGLNESIAQYITECKNKDIVHLFKVLLEGMPIVSKMNIHWFDFNPEVDGIVESKDSYCEVFNQQLILYSFNDGIEDEVLRGLTNDYNCGVVPVGYNMRLNLHEEITIDDIAEFVDNKDLGKKFAEWSGEYYRIVKKFDAIQEKEEKDDD